MVDVVGLVVVVEGVVGSVVVGFSVVGSSVVGSPVVVLIVGIPVAVTPEIGSVTVPGSGSAVGFDGPAGVGVVGVGKVGGGLVVSRGAGACPGRHCSGLAKVSFKKM